MASPNSSSEYVSYEKVKRIMNELNSIFTSYYELVTEIDTDIENNFNAGAESALSSKLGGDFLSKWNSAASTFGEFKTKFDNYYSKVLNVTKNTSDLETETINLMNQLNEDEDK